MKKNSLLDKMLSDRADYERICKNKGIYPMLVVVDWYWHYNKLK